MNIGIDKDDFTVYQDASKTCLASINSAENGKATFTILNTEGKIIKVIESKIEEGNNLIPIADNQLNKGIYLVQYAFKGQQTTKKILIN